MVSKRKIAAVAGLLSGAVTWGIIWYPYRLFQDAGISGEMASFLTYFFALMLGLPFFASRLARVSLPGWMWVWIALAAGWTNLAYVLAVIHGEVMRVLLLFYLAPLWTVILARLMLGEKLDNNGYWIVLLSFGGAFVMLWRPGSGLPLPENSAEWLGLSAGFMFALTNVLTRKAQDLQIWLKSFAVWIGVVLLSAVPLLGDAEPWLALASLPLSVWALLAGVGVVLFVVTLTVQYGVTHTPANQAIVIFLFELVVAAISSYFLASEALSAREWAGGLMIIAASLFSGRLEKGK